MKKDLTLCLDSFSGVEKKCYCIENTSKTFYPCPIGKFKLQNHPFYLIFCPQRKYLAVEEVSFTAEGVYKFRQGMCFSAGGNSFTVEEVSSTAEGVSKIRQIMYLLATGNYLPAEEVSLTVGEVYKFRQGMCFSAEGNSFKTVFCNDRTLRCWNKPYY